MAHDYDRIFVTGDTHADFRDLITSAIRYNITDRDLLIILGDVGINYFGDWRDQRDKDELAMIPATILCIHGNHELWPTSREVAELYHPIQWKGDTAYVEDAYPRLLWQRTERGIISMIGISLS